MALLTSKLQRVGIYIKKYVILHKMLNSGFRDFKSIILKSIPFLVAKFICTYGYLFELIFALLTFGYKGIRVLVGPFSRSKSLRYTQNFQWVHNSIFPNGKHICSNSLTISLNLGKWDITFIMLRLKCGQP